VNPRSIADTPYAVSWCLILARESPVLEDPPRGSAVGQLPHVSVCPIDHKKVQHIVDQLAGGETDTSPRNGWRFYLSIQYDSLQKIFNNRTDTISMKT
jgi:hypothetical protein